MKYKTKCYYDTMVVWLIHVNGGIFNKRTSLAVIDIRMNGMSSIGSSDLGIRTAITPTISVRGRWQNFPDMPSKVIRTFQGLFYNAYV